MYATIFRGPFAPNKLFSKWTLHITRRFFLLGLLGSDFLGLKPSSKIEKFVPTKLLRTFAR
jgi:hypothetical protein